MEANTVYETWHQLPTSLFTDMLRNISNLVWDIALTTNSVREVLLEEVVITNYRPLDQLQHAFISMIDKKQYRSYHLTTVLCLLGR